MAKLSYEQLENKVLELEDTIARMKRTYEDLLYNLDYDNFSSQVVEEKDGMKAELKVTAEAITTKVSKNEMESAMMQTAEQIQSAVLKGVDFNKATEVAKHPDEITGLNKNQLCLYGDTYYYYNAISKHWEPVEGDTIYSVFNQTVDGFEMKGNVLIDGDTVVTRNLTLSGNVTWDMDNSPVQTVYSADCINWHALMQEGDKYMQMSFDGGKSWSDPLKVVGDDGFDGSDVEITPELIFAALTDGGATQGIFAAFYDGGEKLFINAEYIQTGTLSADRINTDDLSCTRLYAKGYDGAYHVRLNGDYGDFGIFYPNAADNAHSYDTSCLFGVYNAVTDVGLYVNGNRFLSYNGGMFRPQGDWNFSDAITDGLYATAVFG